jgi:hypothetical protein
VRAVYEPYTDSWFEAAEDIASELGSREREPGEDDEDEWRAEMGATEPPEPALEPLDDREVQEVVAALPEAPVKPEAVQVELLPSTPAAVVEIPEKRPWAGAVKNVADFRKVQDDFQRRFVEATGVKPDWLDGAAKTLKTRVDRHGSDEVLRRIANAFEAPPKWFEGVPTVRSFCSHFDSFAMADARAGPARRRGGMSGGDLDQLADEMERKGVT